jgi:hypothetical protein
MTYAALHKARSGMADRRKMTEFRKGYFRVALRGNLLGYKADRATQGVPICPFTRQASLNAATAAPAFARLLANPPHPLSYEHAADINDGDKGSDA